MKGKKLALFLSAALISQAFAGSTAWLADDTLEEVILEEDENIWDDTLTEESLAGAPAASDLTDSEIQPEEDLEDLISDEDVMEELVEPVEPEETTEADIDYAEGDISISSTFTDTNFAAYVS